MRLAEKPLTVNLKSYGAFMRVTPPNLGLNERMVRVSRSLI